jgi:hypothetical protein
MFARYLLKIPQLIACAQARLGTVCIADKTQRTNLCRKHIFRSFVGDHLFRLYIAGRSSGKAASLVKKNLVV